MVPEYPRSSTMTQGDLNSVLGFLVRERQTLHGFMIVIYKAMLLKCVDSEGFGSLVEL